MIRRTNLNIALKHLTSRLKQTLVAVLSVTFGISMYVFMNSFMSGANEVQTELAFSSMAHVRIYNDLPAAAPEIIRPSGAHEVIAVRNEKIMGDYDGIKNAAPIVQILNANEQVAVVTTQVNQNVIFRNGSLKNNGQLSGIDPINENRMFGLADMMLEGDWNLLGIRADAIILGAGLAKKLSVKVGDHLLVTTTEGAEKRFKTIGIIQTNQGSIDKGKAFVSSAAARQLFSKSANFCTDILANLRDYEAAIPVSQTIAQHTRYTVEPWQQANEQLEAANGLRNVIALAVSLTILVVAGFGIYNIMNMTVNEKIKDIAILKAMGFDGRDITQIFLVQSLIIGFLGGLAGMAFGFVVARIVDNVPFEFAGMTTLPITYSGDIYALAFGFGMAITFLAGYLPANKASKVDPVSIIRG